MSDDDTWFEALAGRATAGQSRSAALEAGLLRRAVERVPEPAQAPLTVDEEQRLLAAASAAVATAAATAAQPAARRCAGCARRRHMLLRWWRAWPFMAPALVTALVAGVAGLLVLLPGRGGDEAQAPAPVLRGAPAASGVVVVPDAQPQQRRDALATTLAGLGATVRRYERLGRHGLQAQFALPLAPATQGALAQLGLAADAEGVVQVEVEALRR